MCRLILTLVSLVFVNDTPATQIYTLSYTTLFRSLLRHPREAGLGEGDGALEARAVRRTAVTTRVREAVVAGGAVLERDVFRDRGGHLVADQLDGPALGRRARPRSEERRVGKEGW